MADTEVYRVGISGSYGGLNLGDEAILQSIVTQLRRSLPVEITVFSRDAADTLERHQVEHAVTVSGLSREEMSPEIERLDLLILGGGGILFDSLVPRFLREVELADRAGVPVMVYAVGAGPLKDPGIQAAVRDALERVEVVTVREKGARQILEEIGVRREILVTADPALLLEPEPLPEDTSKREGMEGCCTVGVSVREPGPAVPDAVDVEEYHRILSDAADFIVDRFNANILFVPMERDVKDVQHSHAVVARMLNASRASVLKGEYTAGQVLSLIGHFEFAVGMRLHFLMFAAMQRVPFVALPYASKVQDFLESLGMTTPPIEAVDAGRVIAHIDASWDRRQELRRQIDERLPELQARAPETGRIAVELLKRGRHERRGRPATATSSTDAGPRVVGEEGDARTAAPTDTDGH